MRLLIAILLLAAVVEATPTGSVIHVARKLRMSSNDPLPPKDYFIDLGTRDGIKIGDVFEVSRQVPVQNSYSGGAWHLMKVSLGELRIYAVGESTSVGRIEIEREPSSLPTMDYHVFMLGDSVEIRQLPVQ